VNNLHEFSAFSRNFNEKASRECFHFSNLAKLVFFFKLYEEQYQIALLFFESFFP